MSLPYDSIEADLQARHHQNRLDTTAAYRSSRPANTVAAYKDKVKEWRVFCDKSYHMLPIERRYTVTDDKVHSWLRDDLMTREKKRGNQKADGTRGMLSHATIYAFVAGVIDLWSEQRESGINSNPHPAPRDGHVRKLLKLREQQEAERRRTDFVDRGQGTSLEVFSSEDLLKCNVWCLRIANESPAKVLRDRLALNLSLSCLLRGHSIRNADLADFHLMHLPNEGPQTAHALCMVIDVDKTIKDGSKYLMGAMRAKDYRVCTQNAFAIYMFFRWHVSGEPFPDMSSPELWYNTKLLLGKPSTTRELSQALSYSSHLESIDKIFSANSINTKAKTHIGRRSGAQMAEMNNVAEMQIRRAGRWNMSVMESRYLNNLPRNFLRAAAGFDQAGGQFFLDRALVDPPTSLMDQLFPSSEKYRIEIPPDLASGGFLSLLRYLRVVLLQDMAVMWKDTPQHVLFSYAPFDSLDFKAFAGTVSAQQEHAEDPAALRLRHLVPDLSKQLGDLRATMQHNWAALDRKMVALPEEIGGIRQELLHSVKSTMAGFLGSIADAAKSFIQTSELPEHAASLTEGNSRQAESEHQPQIEDDSHIGFEMSRSLSTVRQTWQEWHNGLRGVPSVQSMDLLHGNRWRSTARDRKFYSNRKVIVDEVEASVSEFNITPDEAVERLEQLRGGKSLDYLMKQIKAKRKHLEEDQDAEQRMSVGPAKRRRR